jgi:flagellar motor switch/type III secretory pathway protein FliN
MMRDVVPIGPHDLPRVSARDAAVLTSAARLLAGLPRRVETALGDFGTVGLSWEAVDALGPESAGDVVFGISRAIGAGRLVIDAALAHRAVAVALGGEARWGASLARLGLGERGVVAGIIASLLHTLGAPFSVSLMAPAVAGVAAEGGVAIALAVTFADAAGWARLEVPSAWLAAAVPRAVSATELGELDVEVRVELARTWLAAGEVAGVVPGDAIVFDGEPRLALGAGVARSVRVVIGAHAARARLAEDGSVTLEDAFRPASASSVAGSMFVDERVSEEVSMKGQNGEGMLDGPQDAKADATAVLAVAPIEVVAELGRFTLRGEEVVGLGPGAVLTFGRVGASLVALRVGGEVWAEGELVDVDGELGVRVTTSRRSGLPTRPTR